MSIRLLVPCVVAALVCVACDSGPEMLDGSLMRDAAVSDGGGGFLDAGSVDAALPASDAGSIDAGEPLCDALVCDPRESSASCGGSSCVLWSDAPSCDDATGLLTPGQPCAGVGECGPGLACFLDEAGEGVCGQVCCPTDAMGCAAGSSCAGAGVLVDGTPTLWGRCLGLRSCDLLRADVTCEAREGCYLIDSTRMTECRIAGTAAAGEACERQEQCQAGFFCGGIAAARRCVRLCSVSEEDCPIEEGRCVAQSHTPDGVGLCTVDMTTQMRR